MQAKSPIWILIAHGSRLPAANQEVRELAQLLSQRLEGKVLPAFLEIASPGIPEAIDAAAAEQPTEIRVLPYFLTQGRHLSEDIPKIIEEKARVHPEIPIQILNYVGAHPGMVDWLAEIASSLRSSQ